MQTALDSKKYATAPENNLYNNYNNGNDSNNNNSSTNGTSRVTNGAQAATTETETTVVRLRGVPYGAAGGGIRAFFQPLQIVGNDEEGMLFVCGPNRLPSGVV